MKRLERNAWEPAPCSFCNNPAVFATRYKYRIISDGMGGRMKVGRERWFTCNQHKEQLRFNELIPIEGGDKHENN